MNTNQALEIFDYAQINEFDLESLKSKYKKLAVQKHPDKSSGSHSDFIELREAYVLLLEFAQQNTTQNNSKSIKMLNKEELLKKYFEDTQDLQIELKSFQSSMLANIDSLSSVKKHAQLAVSKFERRREVLKKELEQEMTELERIIQPPIFQRVVFFFWPRPSEKFFWQEYYKHVQVYTRKDLDLELAFYKDMLSIYGSALNTIAGHVTETK
jgi:hypothetical protein